MVGSGILLQRYAHNIAGLQSKAVAKGRAESVCTWQCMGLSLAKDPKYFSPVGTFEGSTKVCPQLAIEVSSAMARSGRISLLF